ncbi:MAG: sensor histidine kinase [Planctomycetia bacterium]
MDESMHASPSSALVELLAETPDPELRERLCVECLHSMRLAEGVALCARAPGGWSVRLARGLADDALLARILAAEDDEHAAWMESSARCSAGVGEDARVLVLLRRRDLDETRLAEVQALLFLLVVLGRGSQPLAPLPAPRDDEERMRRHDLRNSLHALSSTHELLKHFGADLPEDERARFEASLDEECRRASRLALSRADGAADLHATLDSVARAERAPCAVAGVQFAMHLPPPEECRSSALEPDAAARALQNLVVNAREALAGRGGRIVASLAREGELWRLVVEDDGPGIDPALATRLFADGASSKGDGRGSGLASIAAALRGLGGSAVAGRSALGGARFALRWPVQG